MKILVADGDSISRSLLRHTLQKFGYEVVLAESDLKAAEILSQNEGPRLALIDWSAPNFDGPDLCREVRNVRNDGTYVYIILLTSKQGNEDIVAGLEAGADDYLTKPCQPAELRARLSTGCRILSLEENLVKARDEMHYRATHDSLTEIWNRATILSLVRTELELAALELRQTSMVLCDVDHFKQINDNYGHLIGDSVLQEIAKRLVGSVCSNDAVGRYGGEEFLILLRNCDSDALEGKSELIRGAVASSPFLTGGEPLVVTISIGAVTCQQSAPSIPLETILAAADSCLYRAKAEGRNRAVIAKKFDSV